MVKFYTSHCPKCRMLSALMDKKGIEYNVLDDERVYLPVADKWGIVSMPFAEIDGKIINDKDLLVWIKQQEDRKID